MKSGYVMKFCVTDFPRNSFAVFEDMMRTGQLCDVTISVNNHSVSAHRGILAVRIPYFRSLFNGSDAENEEVNVSLGNLDFSALETLIHFAYSGRVDISTENAHSLLVASDFLQINQVRDACVKFLSNQINGSNVGKVCTAAHSLNNSTLIESSNRYIRENFEEFSKSDDFLSVPHERLKEIISEDVLNVSCETVVLEAVIRWVKVSPLERQDILPEFLSEVRMLYLPICYLMKTAASEELIRASIPCKDIIEKVQSYHLLPKDESEFQNLETQPRKSYVRSVIYGVHDSGNSIYYCDFTNESWCMMKSKAVEDPSASKYVEIAALANGNIYLFLEKTVERFGLKSLEWKLLEPRHKDIGGAAVLSHGNLIYFFGSSSVNFRDTMRRFDSCRNNWMKEEKMKTGRSHSATAILGESIYITGGRVNGQVSSTVEKYNVSTGRWSRLSSMVTPRYAHGCTNLNGMIYVCGGYSLVDYFCSSAEMYNPLTDQWNTISSMNTGKSFVSLISHGKKIYALGCLLKCSKYAREFEVFDPKKDQWKSGFIVPEGIRYYVV